jgi:hypothetical protein
MIKRHTYSLGQVLFVFALALAPAAYAQPSTQKAPKPTPSASKADDVHRNEDIAKHRQMARAHEDAARCLEAGEKESACQAKLREACKGVAVGPYCGMRHGH